MLPFLAPLVVAADYLGQTPPGDDPQVFAPGLVSVDGRNTHALQFSPDERFAIFSRYPDGTSFRVRTGQAPEPVPFHGKEVSFDRSRQRIFYYDRGDLYYVRDGATPVRLPASINTAETEYYPSVTAKDNLYFSRGGAWPAARIFRAPLQGEGFGEPMDLGDPINRGGASHAFVASDESYMLFNSPRAGSHTQNDIWVSFRNPDGSWGTPSNLGPGINSHAQAVLCPTVSPDGKYLFFTRLQENRTGFIYWVSTRVIEQLRPDFGGTQRGEVTAHDVMMVESHVPRLIQRRTGGVIPEPVEAWLDSARAASQRHDYYRAFRLYARAAGLAAGPGKVEQYEVAAALTPSLDRAVYGAGESIRLTVRPLFTLGQPLTRRYVLHAWLETPRGSVSGSQQALPVVELKEYRFDFPVQTLPEGELAVCYRLVSPESETMAEIRHAVVVAPDAARRLERLTRALAAMTRQTGQTAAFASARDTIEYVTESLDAERTTFQGGWRRSAHPFGMYLAAANFAASGRTDGEGFPRFNARIRYPEDVRFAESLVSEPEAIASRSGDMTQGIRSVVDGTRLRYRVFVPEGYTPARKYPLLVALHSGAGDWTYFDGGLASSGPDLKQLAQARGYVVACPNGASGSFLDERDDADTIALVERLERLYSIDVQRVFLTGWSVGGSATWRLAMRHPGLFAAAAPVGGDAAGLTGDTSTKARSLPILFSVSAMEAAQAKGTADRALALLPLFTMTIVPDTDHISVWSKALPGLFEFLDRVRRPSFRGLCGVPCGAEQSMASQVSVDGAVVVGTIGANDGARAFRWTERDGMVSLSVPFDRSWAAGVSADGAVIAGYGDRGGHRGFLWRQGGSTVELGREALAVSADGAVVVGDDGREAFRWTSRGGLTRLGVLPGRTNSRAVAVSADGAVVTGSSYILPGWEKEEAFLWAATGGLQTLDLPTGSFPNAISPDGTAIGGTAFPDSGPIAFRWTRDGGMTVINHLPGRRMTHPGAVSANGAVVVGGSYVDRDRATAFLWDAAHGTRSLKTVLETEYGLDLSGWILEHASGITPDGAVIVGWGTNPEGRREAFRAVLAGKGRNHPE
jgi:uncharacterized membrane protein/dienelactone hydrolase